MNESYVVENVLPIPHIPQIGDKVVHRTVDEIMTFVELQGDIAKCVWGDKETHQEQLFPLGELSKIIEND